MQDMVELERRITAALERIGAGIDRLPLPAPVVELPSVEVLEAVVAQEAVTEAETPLAEAAASEILAAAPEVAAPEAEGATIARLRERLAQARDRETVLNAKYEERIAVLTRLLDAQGAELQRMRRTSLTLREELRVLREASAEGLHDPALIDRAMLAELESLRAARQSEITELDELAVALDQHLTEAENA